MSARRRRRSEGQALVEFALTIPIFLLIVFGILDLGRAVWTLDIANHAAAEAARYAIVHGGSPETDCPVGPLSGGYGGSPQGSTACPHPSPSKLSIYDVATKAAIGAGSGVTVEACYGVGCTGNTDTADNSPGNPVTVTVKVHVTIFSGALLGVGDIDVVGSSTMTVNN